VRVAADGSLRACLGGRERLGLKQLLRDGADDRAIAASIVAALAHKHARHEMARQAGQLVPMIGTGG
jgi:GTP 3',8-cyclase